ncbi:tetratricopeptide repeat-containing glycosyltransferase family 2 protein [Clostridium amazonitimonense]|uniref:tetratricopeptide repeat-containing glycosyltransferase family 2 protein n=1 Tax=Clostridium amazonitimonense TaxID=1499689 RepID=UPI000509A5E3|nr:glycosyltransferase [Clostridium amazonitimonense]
MITISLCMIVKDEEDVIDRCLDCVKDIVDEIIIVDTGSTDNTKEIIKEYTDKVFDFQWIDDFSAARNYAFSKATKDYILWLDADDVIFEKDRERFKELKQNLDNKIDAVMMKYNVGFDEDGNVTLSYFRERLSKRIKNYQWMEPVHEYLKVDGNIINSDICITHKKERIPIKGRNLSIYQKTISKGEDLSPRGIYYYARELYYNGNYDEAIKYFEEFLNTGKGWIEDNINACYILSTCYNNKNDQKKMLEILLKSFEYDTPRAEICCQLGAYYFNNKDYKRAIFWYKLVLDLEKPIDGWGFISHDYWGYIPCIQLCVCYDKLGNTEEAIKYNNKAEEYKPKDPSVAYNKNYFKSISER